MFVFDMTLDEYLTAKELSDADFARQIRVSTRSVGYYRTGERCPRPKVMAKIFEVTSGKVAPNDFYSGSAS